MSKADFVYQPAQYGVDTAAALTAAFFASPVVMCVDRAIAEAACGTRELMPSFLSSMKNLITSPKQFLLQPGFKYVYLIYSASYLAANTSRTFCNQIDVDDAFPSWAFTSVFNMSACIYKDYKFAQLYGQAKPVPPKSLAIWAFRDGLTMYSSLTLPKMVAAQLKKSLPQGQVSDRQVDYIAQFFTPLLFQIVLTPIHRWGYFAYANESYTTGELATFLRSEYFRTVGLRLLRCLAPWSVGQSINNDIRNTFNMTNPRAIQHKDNVIKHL